MAGAPLWWRGCLCPGFGSNLDLQARNEAFNNLYKSRTGFAVHRGVFIQQDSLTVWNNGSNSKSGKKFRWRFTWHSDKCLEVLISKPCHSLGDFGRWSGWEAVEATEKGSSLVAPPSHPSPSFPWGCTWGVLWAFSGSLQKKIPERIPWGASNELQELLQAGGPRGSSGALGMEAWISWNCSGAGTLPGSCTGFWALTSEHLFLSGRISVAWNHLKVLQRKDLLPSFAFTGAFCWCRGWFLSFKVIQSSENCSWVLCFCWVLLAKLRANCNCLVVSAFLSSHVSINPLKS